ncbi:hypothetical protein B0H67DRAFT_513003 [Lasiosphaeris hirsuta]|uniref:Bul1 C-terminal domain-containing protein n=1 Tax=Lasiosphaeris hirsuta TaxID=260670 RepID=A0AA40AEW9_9PEZI|nr:hypothetical protein B0H67DRAFT_513003 [Lasiosphaeris hirsuta]
MAASSISGSSDFQSSARRMAYPRSNIEINLDNHYNSKVYSTLSPVAGNVTITTKRDVRFDSIQILLVGNTKTRVDGVSSPHEVTHTFLKMLMPIPESTYPVPRILETGETYTIPFNFVIPTQLTIGACHHHMQSDLLQDQHVLLPPTMGRWEKDDMAPQMVQVEYSVKARVLRDPEVGEARIRIMEAVKPIQVLPVSVEEPPLNITEADTLYIMAKSKSVRRNVLSSKLGRLTAEAGQPGPAVLRSDGLYMVSQPTAQIHLSFEPTSPDVLPPKVTAVSGKITAHSFFASGTISNFPNMGEWNQQFVSDKRGAYSTSASLPAMSAPKVRWTQQLSAATRRDSGYSSDHNNNNNNSPEYDSRASRQQSESSTTAAGSPIFHTAVLQIPILLPTDKKTFVPTFHSCIASRVYTVQLSLTVSVGSAATTVSLTLPIQVGVEAEMEQAYGGMGLPSFEAAVAEAEADAHLQPRVLTVPELQYVQTSVLPGYRAVGR